LILAAVDDSEYAELVTREATRTAREKKSDVVFLSVVQVPSLAGSEGEIDAAYLSEKEESFQRIHNRLIDSYFTPDSGILSESRILHWDPADKIVKYADETNADLTIVGSRGTGD
jgi:nucleotide-binding universal stress UspA family protein